MTIIGGLQATTRPSSNAAADQIPPMRSAFAVEHRGTHRMAGGSTPVSSHVCGKHTHSLRHHMN